MEREGDHEKTGKVTTDFTPTHPPKRKKLGGKIAI